MVGPRPLLMRNFLQMNCILQLPRLLFSIDMKKFLALFFSIALSAALNAHAAPVANNTPGFIKQAADLGPLDPNSMINVTVWLQLHNEGKLDSLVKEQKQKGSSNYHKWITHFFFQAEDGIRARSRHSC